MTPEGQKAVTDELEKAIDYYLDNGLPVSTEPKDRAVARMRLQVGLRVIEQAKYQQWIKAFRKVDGHE